MKKTFEILEKVFQLSLLNDGICPGSMRSLTLLSWLLSCEDSATVWVGVEGGGVRERGRQATAAADEFRNGPRVYGVSCQLPLLQVSFPFHQSR